MAVSLLAYLANFSIRSYFGRNYFFTLLQGNYFDTTVTFPEQLFFQSFNFF